MPYLNSNIVPLFLECGKRNRGRKKKTKCRDLAIFLSNEKVRIPVFDIDIVLPNIARIAIRYNNHVIVANISILLRSSG